MDIKDVREEIKSKIDTIPVYRSEITDTVRLIGEDIKKLKEENKQLKKSLTDAKCRVILLEENYITLLEDLTYSAKIDLFIYITFAICIAILGFFVYGLTH
jgi:hypothetical protein